MLYKNYTVLEYTFRGIYNEYCFTIDFIALCWNTLLEVFTTVIYLAFERLVLCWNTVEGLFMTN